MNLYVWKANIVVGTDDDGLLEQQSKNTLNLYFGLKILFYLLSFFLRWASFEIIFANSRGGLLFKISKLDIFARFYGIYARNTENNLIPYV